jgi:hypothetical protein
LFRLDPDRAKNLFSDYFWQEMAPVERGALLHEARSPRLPPNYPTIDDEKAGLVISTKTIDLAAAGYQIERRLRYVVNTYVRQIAEFDGDEEISRESITGRKLDLIIPRNFSTEAQWEILQRAISRARERGVELKITRF